MPCRRGASGSHPGRNPQRTSIAWAVRRRPLVPLATLLLLAAPACKGEASSDEAKPESSDDKASKDGDGDADGKTGADADKPDTDEPDAKAGEAGAHGELTQHDVVEVGDTKELVREEETPVPGKVIKNPGFKLEPLLSLYALDGSVSGTSFGAPVTDEVNFRDEDLDTAAVCTPSDDKPCAIGVHFPDQGEVAMLRLYMAAGPKYRDYKASPRPKDIKIYTDAGVTELELADGAAHRYIQFDPPVATSNLSIEVVSTHSGGKDEQVHFAELEIYGASGPARPPMELDPSAAITYFETKPWKDKGGGRSTVKMTWVETVGYEGVGKAGGTRRLQRGGALFGKKGDRFMLVEKLLGATCDVPEPSYVLFDTQTRMVYPLGKLAEGAADIHRRTDGLGFMAVPHSPDGEIDTKGIRTIVFDAEKKKFSRKRGKEAWTVAEHAREWSFEETPERRGGQSLESWVAEQGDLCSTPSDEKLALLHRNTKLFSKDDPGTWISCNIGDGHDLMIGRDAACGEKVTIMLQPPEDSPKVLAEYKDGSGPRRLTIDDSFPIVLVEVGKDSGASSDVVPVNIDYHDEKVIRGAGLTVHPPAECGACIMDYGEQDTPALPAPDEAEGTEPAEEEPAKDIDDPAPGAEEVEDEPQE